MTEKIYSIIIGSGSYIPTRKITNEDFLQNNFYDSDGNILPKSNEEIIQKFEQITGIRERRYVTGGQVVSDIAYEAAKEALKAAKISGEELDYIIVAHNFGDISEENRRSEFVPTIASRVKHHLGIENSQAVAYDLPFGCAGWLQAVIQADYYIKSEGAKKVMVIGAETLSRVNDPHDRDSMIYADGAGAVILSATQSTVPVGILSNCTKTYAGEPAYLLRMDKSFNPGYKSDYLFLKMQGRKLYEHALKFVPGVVKESIDKAGLSLADIDKVLIHQANQKMDEAILKRLFNLYGRADIPENIMPMTISWLGNSSVATLPTLYDLIIRNEIDGHSLTKGKYIVFASVGAGVNMNAIVYKIPG